MSDRLTVTVSGPQGCGKSTIISTIEDHLRARGASVLVEPEYRGAGGADPEGFEVVIREVQADHPSLFEPLIDEAGRITGMKLNGVIESKVLLATQIGGDFNELSREIHEGNVAAGWWSDPRTGLRVERNVGELLMLVVSEVAEAAEGDEFGIMDDKLPTRKMIEVELADTKIRIHDIAGAHELDLQGAAVELLLCPLRTPAHVDDTTQERLLLIVRAVAGAMEGHRKNANDELLQHRKAFEVRLAECLLQIHELGTRLGLDVHGAMVEKRAFNAVRADHKPENRIAEGGKAY